MGATFDWDAEVVTCRARLLPLEPVDLPAVPGGRAWPTAQMAPVDWCPKDQACSRASRSRASTASAGAAATQVEQARPGAVVLPDHRVRRRAARLRGHRLAGADPAHADELDRPLRGRRVVFRDGPGRPPRRRRGAARLHDAAGHAVRRHLHGARARAPARRRADRARPRGPRSRPTSRQARRETEIERLSTDREKTGVAIGADAINPVNGERIPIWIADYVLSGYGTGAIMAVPGPRRARLRVRPAVRPADPSSVVAGRRRRGRRRARRAPTSRTPTSEVLVNSGDRTAGMPGGRGVAGDRRATCRGAGKGEADGHLSPARLAHQPAALLGHAHPGRLLRSRLRHRAGPRGGAAGAAAGRRRLPERRRQPARPDDRGLPRDAPAPAAARPARRETDTMDTFVDSSWYWFRYLSPARRRTAPSTRDLVDRWTPGRPVHRRRRARGDAPALQPLLHEGDARPRR